MNCDDDGHELEIAVRLVLEPRTKSNLEPLIRNNARSTILCSGERVGWGGRGREGMGREVVPSFDGQGMRQTEKRLRFFLAHTSWHQNVELEKCWNENK